MQLAAFELAGWLIGEWSEEQREQFAPSFVQQLFTTDRSARLSWLEDHMTDLPVAFRSRLIEQLASSHPASKIRSPRCMRRCSLGCQEILRGTRSSRQ
jgi:hypothetical protein